MNGKISFTIKVREINNGFIIVLENRHGIEGEEKYCKNHEAILEQIAGWIKKLKETND